MKVGQNCRWAVEVKIGRGEQVFTFAHGKAVKVGIPGEHLGNHYSMVSRIVNQRKPRVNVCSQPCFVPVRNGLPRAGHSLPEGTEDWR